jgi:hypothetical protein
MMSRSLREACKKLCPRVSANQIENRVSVGDSDYIFMYEAQGRMVELKVDKSKSTGVIKVKLRREQRIKLRKECQMGNPAYMMVWSRGLAYLLPGDSLDIFNIHGKAALHDVESKAVGFYPWPVGTGIGPGVRALMRYLFG